VSDFLNFLSYFLLSLIELSGNPANYNDGNTLNVYISKKEPQYLYFNENLVNRFYALNKNNLYWFSLTRESVLRRKSFKNNLDSSLFLGLDKDKYNYQIISGHFNDLFLQEDSAKAMQLDRIFTDVALKYGLDIYHGSEIASWINADEISPGFERSDESRVMQELLDVGYDNDLSQYVHSLEPRDTVYRILKTSLAKMLDSIDLPRVMKLSTSLNQYRWVHHFSLDKFIIVNIPSATLTYWESDTAKLKMKVVLGKPSTRTPRFAAHCDKIILFPYWNVPHKIAVNEFLPIFKKIPAMVTTMNMQILDSRGKIIPEDSIHWSLYSKSYFPYRIRQSTGCDNALGVMKFNITSPFDVYLHDTNLKSAFKSDERYYSHGCIRLEKPFELANYLLTAPVDTGILNSGLKDQNPKTIMLSKPVPVFVIYMTTEVMETDIRFYPDIYGLLK
jgi:L,D-transpeptidase YcbB